MNNFLKVIQYLGTINVYSSTEMTDRCDLPQSINGYCTINKGFHQMDKDTALWYARSTIGGEQSRMLRSHEILSAIFSGLMNINAPERVGELFSTFQNNVETDMTTADLRALIPLSNLLLNPERVRRYTFTAEEAVPFTLPGGEKVLLLDQNAAWSLIQFAVFQP